jgi:hypothetical protein
MIVSQTSRPDIEAITALGERARSSPSDGTLVGPLAEAVTALIGYVGRLEAQQTELQQAVDSLSADPIYEE